MRRAPLLEPSSTQTDEAWVLREDRGPVSVFTLNRPQVLNALSASLIAQLLKRLEAADADDAVRAMVLTGGPKAFAAGADINEMAGRSAAQMSKRLIAAVNGFALGGGCELAMACDLIVAADDAQFGQPEVLIGVMPGAGG